MKHCWSNEQIEYNKLLHKNYNRAWNSFMALENNNKDVKFTDEMIDTIGIKKIKNKKNSQ